MVKARFTLFLVAAAPVVLTACTTPDFDPGAQSGGHGPGHQGGSGDHGAGHLGLMPNAPSRFDASPVGKSYPM